MRPQVRIDPSLPEAPLPHNRNLYLFPGYDTVPEYRTTVPALRPKQKFELAYKTIFDPSLLVRAGFTTGFDEAAGIGPSYGPGWGNAGKLYAYNATNVATMYFFVDGLMPVVFHQDPRYFRKGSGSVKSRIGWALRSEVMAYSDRGKPMPNYSELTGNAMSAALSEAYLPAKNVSVGGVFEGFAIKEAVGLGFDVLREFGGVKAITKKIRGM